MGFDLQGILSARSGEGADLWGRYLNPVAPKVLHSIGFDRQWERAEGSYLYDSTGTRYLDYLSGFGVFGVGRSNAKIRQVLHDALDADLADMVQMDTPLLAGLLGEALIERAPYLDRVYFSSSGTEAVEAALKFARCATGRPRVLYCDHAFHGLTSGSLSVNGAREFRDGFGPLLPATMVPYGDLDALQSELLAGDVAAFIVEPVQGKTVHVAPPGYLSEAAALLHKHGALMICDEVQTGLGRTGRFLSHEYDDVQPDIVTVAKTLSGGFAPVAATMGTNAVFEKVYSGLDRMLVHDSTYSGNTLAMAAGLATLAVLDDEGLIANAAAMGAELMHRLTEAAARYELVSDVRGRGLMIGIEFSRPASRRLRRRYGPLTVARRGLFTQMVVCALFEQHHIVSQTAGDHVDVLKILPPLITDSEEAGYFVDSFCSVMDAIHDSSRPVWHFGWGLTTRAASTFRSHGGRRRRDGLAGRRSGRGSGGGSARGSGDGVLGSRSDSWNEIQR